LSVSVDAGLNAGPQTPRGLARHGRISGLNSLCTPADHPDPKTLSVSKGVIPEDLAGVLFRVGPGRFETEEGPLPHWFDGEGLVVRVSFGDGQARASWRRVIDPNATRTGMGRFGVAPRRFIDRLRSVWGSDSYVNLANTALLLWNGRLFALYEAARPMELDPETLAVVGETDLGVVRRAFSAHPKYHPPSGSWINQGFRVFPGPHLDYYRLDKDGKAHSLGSIRYDGGSIVHDFALTHSHIISISPPGFASARGVLFGGQSIAEALSWDADRKTRFYVSPIGRPDDVFAVEVGECFYTHTANAYERDGEIIIHGIVAGDGRGIDWVGAVHYDAQNLPENAPSRLTEIRINLQTKSVSMQPVAQACVDFPTVEQSQVCAPTKTVFGAGFNDDRQAYKDFFTALVRIDVGTGKVLRHDFGSGLFPCEPAIAGGGRYLLTIVYDANRDESFVSVLTTEPMAEIARASLGGPLPLSFHGLWDAA